MSKQAGASRTGWRGILRWPAFLIANIALFLLIGVSTARESYQGWTVDHQIQALQNQADQLEGRKSKLMELTSTLASNDQVELDARKRLGWKKPGEQVYVLEGYHPSSTVASDPSVLGVPNEPEPESLPRQWLDYFFHPRQASQTK